ncbi:MAG: helix-turn-helix domain-containing protein [Treponema sp.]|jgi:AraC-like DNA-binding protein|nr:helix-turn-helix domain-containing protein [Treponema sp.]
MAFPANGNLSYVSYLSAIPVVLYENRENENYPLHWHTATEIIMPLEGEYLVFPGSKHYRLRENDILIVPPLELHRIETPPPAKNGRRIIVQFETTPFFSLPGLSSVFPGLNTINLITPEKTPEIYGSVRTLLLDSLAEHITRDTFSNIAIYTKIMELYVTLARYYCSKKAPFLENTGDRRQEYLARLCTVLDYIDRHIADELSLDSVAKVANFSKFHFERIFKAYTNQSFYQYLQRRRVERAERLLVNPELTITEAAMEAGFASITAFNRVFKKIKKCTPSEFKKLYLFRKGGGAAWRYSQST